MQHFSFRRSFLKFAPLGLAVPIGATIGTRIGARAATTDAPVVPSMFPTQPPDLVREMVSVSHGNVKRVRELLKDRPALAKASWDWGFGDWETALGAASHVGNREIAEFLIEQGAPPTLFSATMLGHLDVVKSLIAAQPGVERIPGPHSISLLAHAKAGGAGSVEVLRYLESLGDAGATPEAPISAEEVAALAGTYVFGSGPGDRIDISVAEGKLMFTRVGTTARRLFFLGDRAFYPAGSKAVRVRFTGDAKEMALSVHDPEPVVTARRLPATA
jgi:hypothetical protein